MTKLEFECKRCNVAWGGYNTAHCHSCGNVFSTQSVFDKHRSGSYSKGRYCLDPESAVNEVQGSPHFGERLFRLADRAYPCWTTAGGREGWWKE